MKILGINYGSHDPCAALVIDGRIIAIGEQERFSRNKGASGEFPGDAAKWCLEVGGIEYRDLDVVTVGWDDSLYASGGDPLPPGVGKRSTLEEGLTQIFGHRVAVTPVPHHVAHAASTFFCSPFDSAAILINDGSGENECLSLAIGAGDSIKIIDYEPIARSLGYFYLAAARYAGLGREGEGKLMGLACYGRPNQPMPIEVGSAGYRFVEEVQAAAGEKPLTYLRPALNDWWSTHNFPYGPGDGVEPHAYADFAASVQAALEAAIVAKCRKLVSLSGSSNLVVAGGVAQNCSANRRIVESDLFEHCYFQPQSHDAGVALGSALWVAAQSGDLKNRRPRMDSGYFGRSWSQHDCESALTDAGLKYQILTDQILFDRVAMSIHDSAVVGWFAGRSEVGPRALGARSILGNPTTRSTLVRINAVKDRAVWRPLAPSVLSEQFDQYFDSVHKSPFMNVAAVVRGDKRSAIPAVVHVDGTARPQSVTQAANPRYWGLISAFERLSGIPMLVNTSFNTREEPIVDTPREAIRTAQLSGLDLLVLENCLVDLREN